MQFLVSILVSIVLGYRAKQKGKDGLKFGAGVAVLLLAPSAILGFWDQAVGVHQALWWVLAAFITAIAWLRLENSKGSQQVVNSTQVSEPKTINVESTTPKPWTSAEAKHVWAEALAWAKMHKLKAAGNIILGVWVLGSARQHSFGQ